MRLLQISNKKLLENNTIKNILFQSNKRSSGINSCKKNLHGRRLFSTNSNENNEATASFSEYEFPLRTEAPIITRTNSSDIDYSSIQQNKASTKLNINKNEDNSSVSEEEIKLKLSKQKENLPNLNSKLIRLDQPLFTDSGGTATTTTKPTSKLLEEEPLVEITTIENGIKVITQESKNQPFVTSIGVFSTMGSKFEIPKQTTGMNHLMDIMTFNSINDDVQKLGGVCYSNSTRDQTMYCLDIVRNELTTGLKLFQDGIFNPNNYKTEDIEYGKMVLGYQWEDSLPEMKLSECLMLAAYKQNSSLGKWHFCPPHELGNDITSDTIHQFRNDHFVPNEMVLSATGLSHEDLVDIANQYFGHLEPNKSTSIDEESSSDYIGGEHRLTIPPRKQLEGQEILPNVIDKDNFTRIALAYEIPHGWNNKDLVPICVLQTLLGGGSSFSAGGPGKGMYSRLYREILNRYHWVESSEAFTLFHANSGLFGIQGSTCHPSSKSAELVQVFMEHFYKCCNVKPSDIEVTRAKNMLKCNVLSQLESRLVIMEDLGRQILTYGKRESMVDMLQKIDAVTPEDIQRVSLDLMKYNKNGGVSLAVVGENVDYVPSLDEIKRWL